MTLDEKRPSGTPDALAEYMVRACTCVHSAAEGAAVLVMCAADSALWKAVLAASDRVDVTVLETDTTRWRAIDPQARLDVVHGDVLALSVFSAPCRFAAVLMNPVLKPAEAGTGWEREFGVAWGMVARGGDLVCVLPRDWADGRFGIARLVEQVGRVIELEELTGGAGELADAVLVHLRRPEGR